MSLLRVIAACVVFLVLCGAAQAADEPPAANASRHLETPNLVTPIVRQGQLRNYVYVTVRVVTPEGVDAQALREKGHFLRDALLRATHDQDLADPTRDDQLNQARATAVFTQVAKSVLGEASVQEVQLLFITSLRRAPGAARGR